MAIGHGVYNAFVSAAENYKYITDQVATVDQKTGRVFYLAGTLGLGSYSSFPSITLLH